MTKVEQLAAKPRGLVGKLLRRRDMAKSSEEQDKAIERTRRLALRIPRLQARAVRELAQKEYEGEVRANDAIVTRANTMLSASAVALGLLVGLSKETTAIASWKQRLPFVLALSAAAVAIVYVIRALFVRGAETAMQNDTILGEELDPPKDDKEAREEWQHKHELVLTGAYLEMRTNVGRRQEMRAILLRKAQWAYLAFLGFVTLLGIAVIWR